MIYLCRDQCSVYSVFIEGWVVGGVLVNLHFVVYTEVYVPGWDCCHAAFSVPRGNMRRE